MNQKFYRILNEKYISLLLLVTSYAQSNVVVGCELGSGRSLVPFFFRYQGSNPVLTFKKGVKYE